MSKVHFACHDLTDDLPAVACANNGEVLFTTDPFEVTCKGCLKAQKCSFCKEVENVSAGNGKEDTDGSN